MSLLPAIAYIDPPHHLDDHHTEIDEPV